MGFNLKSAGVSIDCGGNESQLINCSYEDEHKYSMKPKNCAGGATTITCLAKGTKLHVCVV